MILIVKLLSGFKICFRANFKMLHPYIPFITEEIWQKIKLEGESIVIANYPNYDEKMVDKNAMQQFDYLKKL